jgi:dihydrofolate reductase
VLFMGTSLDGFMAGPDGDLSWHQVDEELHQHFNDVLAEADAFLEGRVTFELMAEHWPTADEQPDATAAERHFARIWRDTPRIVYSRTLESSPWATRIVRDVVPAEVQALKEEGDGELVLGGADLAESFFAHDLVDELRVYVHPVLVGGGARSFGSVPRGVWRLFETRTFTNGVVLLRYRRG